MKPSQAKQIVEAWHREYNTVLHPDAIPDLIAAIAAAPCKECAEKAARIQQQDIFIRNDHEGECVDNEIAQAARIAELEAHIRAASPLIHAHHEPDDPLGREFVNCGVSACKAATELLAQEKQT